MIRTDSQIQFYDNLWAFWDNDTAADGLALALIRRRIVR